MLLEVVRAVMWQLSSADGCHITARHRFGWTLHRIARAFALTPSAADGRIRRAIAALRTRAEQEGWTDDE